LKVALMGEAFAAAGDAFAAAAHMSDPFSSLTHLIGSIAFAWLGASLVRRAEGDPARRAAVVIFAFSVSLMLLVSGIFHLLPHGSAARYVMQRVDHAAVFILIAATFTPMHAILFRGPARWGVLSVVWTIAIVGLTFKSVYFGAIPEWLSLALYLAFGWLGLASGLALSRRLGYAFIRPLVLGAFAYTLGAITDFAQWPILLPSVIGAHELFHLAVLAGIACHWQFVQGFASGRYPLPVNVVRKALAPALISTARHARLPAPAAIPAILRPALMRPVPIHAPKARASSDGRIAA
jgi:channel protein (hemolysin III family)